VSIDFSRWQAEIVYTNGRDSFIVPQGCNSLALVERDESLYRYQRYLNHRVGQAEVWRLRLQHAYV
jgi:hypothetical protein